MAAHTELMRHGRLDNLTITIRGEHEKEAAQRPLDLKIIRRLVAYMRPYRAKRNWLFVLVILRSVQLPAIAWSIGAVINGPITRRDAWGTALGALGFGVLVAFTQFTLHFRQRLALELGEAVVHDLRNELFDHLLRMPLSFFTKTKRGRVISRVTSDVEAVREGVQNVMYVSLVALGQMVVSAALMAHYDWMLFCVVLCIVPVLWALNQGFRGRFSRATRSAQESFSRITATLAESVSGIRVTQGFVRQQLNAELFRRLLDDHSRYRMDVARTSGLFLPLLEINSQFFIAVLLLLGGYHVLSPEIHAPIGTLIQFFFLAGIFFGPINMLGNIYNQALTAMAGGERVFSVLDTKPDWTDDPDARDIGSMTGRVECRDLSFCYDPGRKVLRNISFVAEPGRTIALVGATGSGKTTLIGLISKFYLPTEGEILIDGSEIRRITSESLHRQLGIIQQQNFLFTGTIRENIRLGKPAATDDEITAAARALDCLDLIEALPDGFDTVVGERGTGLSLGQRQLVCFVRAMLADPRIFILDEATSSVDTMTEARIQQSLVKLLENRTCFIIAHRLSTIRHADSVLVLDNGRIVERGTHVELLLKGGLYANLYRQFAYVGWEEE
ncbi:ABC transporter ATP-binding protein [bacterium]|nr:ABC transporter ATP-binding protein [bacterium]